jgi:predicted nuclease of predicted toxin-antitoxin system
MKFLVDAQLPRRIARWLGTAGLDAVHTLDLPAANRTPDSTILRIAAAEKRVIVTKDADFVSSFVLTHQPEKLLLISTGNITNVQLEALLVPNIDAIAAAFNTSNFVELTRTSLIIHP